MKTEDNLDALAVRYIELQIEKNDMRKLRNEALDKCTRENDSA